MSVSRSRSETRAFWQRQVNSWVRSGLSKAAFCRECDLHPASCSQWSVAPRVPKRQSIRTRAANC